MAGLGLTPGGGALRDVVHAFLARRFAAQLGRRPLTAETPLFSTGIVDSFGVLELIAFLEDEFAVSIDPASHELDEFDTIAKIDALVVRLRAGTKGA